MRSVTLPMTDARPPTTGPLTDTFGRVHNNLRISVTDRCNLRCKYCMAEDVEFLNRSDILSFEEITHFVRVAATLGVNKVRLTGGEPLLRKDLPRLIAMLLTVNGIAEVGLTTNGLLLSELACQLEAAGLRRINISLDSLDPATFKSIARRDDLDRVLKGIAAAQQAGLRVKLNAVILRGVNEGDIVRLAHYARDIGATLRFIEAMPIGADVWERGMAVLAGEIITTIQQQIGPLQLVGSEPHAPAVDYEYLDGRGRVGVIASISRPFCRECNRLRLTADGKLRNCLFALDETDVRPFLRGGSDDAIAVAIRGNIWSKWEGHEINSAQFVKPARTMHAIGG